MISPLKIIKPKKLQINSTIGLVCPSGFINKKQLEKTKKVLQILGFKIYYTNIILNKYGYLAGTDKERANDLNNMFANKNVDGILAIRGGYGGSRIVANIDYELIKEHPKIFIGYSDITVLLNSIYKYSGLITFHGVVGISDFNEYTKQNFIDLFINNKLIIKQDSNVNLFVINEGKATGILVGGNLSIITSLLSTNYEVDFTDKIVFIEEIGEAPYKIDRMFTQLLLSGKLQKAKAIILGVFNNCDFNNKDITKKNSLSLQEVFIDRLKMLNIPIMSNFSFGHIDNQAIFPIGINIKIDTEKRFITLLESPFC